MRLSATRRAGRTTVVTPPATARTERPEQVVPATVNEKTTGPDPETDQVQRNA
jgi:hypothetical protein